MLGFSLLLHVAVIASIQFKAPDLNRFKDQLPSLEVMLVNAKTEAAPIDPKVLAQANLDRGGNTEAQRQMKSPLPVPKQKPSDNATVLLPQHDNTQQESKKRPAKIEDEVAQKERKVEELEKQVQQVLTQTSDTTAPAPKPATPEAAQQTKNSSGLKFNAHDLVSKYNAEILQREAELAKEQDDYQKRPKKRFIGARAREDRDVFYLEAWRQKVESIGSLNYPAEATAQKLYGRLVMTVSIRADGSIESIEMERGSGFKVLDDAARRIVELGAPYAAFPANISKDTDILVITKTWTFTREDRFVGN
jgi:protein TonB